MENSCFFDLDTGCIYADVSFLPDIVTHYQMNFSIACTVCIVGKSHKIDPNPAADRSMVGECACVCASEVK